MNTTKTKIKRTTRRKTEATPLEESINQYVDSNLANGEGSPQEVFSVAVRNFSKRLLEAMLQGEMEAHLNGVRPTADENSAEEGAGNKRNGLTQKTLKTEYGPLTVDVPRDRNSSFDPVVVPKHCRSFGKIDEQIITMYSRGMSTRDIQAFVENLYGVNISPDYVSAVTDRVLEEMQEWTGRSLESVYPVVFFDALRVKIRSGAAVKNMAVHLAVGVRVDGTREVLGMWLAENEGAAFWAGVFNGLKNRGVEDILIAVTDGLKGMTEALETVFPQALHQTCIVHLIRSSTAFISHKDRAVVCKALKPIYQAVDERTAQQALEAFEQSVMGRKYPAIAQAWRRVWAQVVPFFSIPAGDPGIDLYDQLHRGTQPRNKEGHQDALVVPQRGGGAEANLSGHHELYSDVEEALAQVVCCHASVRPVIRRAIYGGAGIAGAARRR